MADNSEKLTQMSFSIQDTMDLGGGNPQLIDDLFADESPKSPEDIEEIEKAPIDPPIPPAKKPAKQQEAPKEELEHKDKEKENDQDILADFLTGDEDDEIDKDKKPVEKKEEEEQHDEVDEQATYYTALAQDLERLGVFTKEEDEESIEIKTPKEFLERFTNEKKKGANEIIDNFIGQFGQDYQNAFEAIFVNGVNPKDYFDTYNTLVNFAELDMSVEDNQIRVIKQTLADQGFEPEDITTEIERLKNYGDLESVATKYHKVLGKKEAAKLQEMEQQSQQKLQQKAALKNQYVQNVQTVLQEKLKTKDFDGIPINAKLANELQDFLLVDKYKTGNGELLTEFDRTVLDLKKPENHTKKVKIALLLKILEKDPALSTIQRSGVTKKSDEIFEQLAKQKTKTKPSQSIGHSFQGL